MANEICYFTSGDAGAPTLNNANGSLIDVLDACLINGYNSKSVTSIVVASNVATATVSAHGYLGGTGKCVDIAGATPSGLNGRKKITVTGSNSFTFPTSGISDQTATGTITVKRSPLGWSKAFSATGKAIYARTDVAATAMLWRVDDTGSGVASTINARSIMVESATGIDTYTAPSPTAAQLADGQYITKGANNSTAKPWAAIGDSRTVYLFTDDASYSFSAYGGLHAAAFGDFTSDKAGDAYAAFVAGASGSGAQSRFLFGATSGTNDFCIARLSSGVGGSCLAFQADRIPNVSIGGNSYPAYPSPVDNGMRIDIDALIRENNVAFGNPYRGSLRGMAHPLASVPNSMHLQVLSNINGFGGEFLVVETVEQSIPGCVLFDITGPWV